MYVPLMSWISMWVVVRWDWRVVVRVVGVMPLVFVVLLLLSAGVVREGELASVLMVLAC